MKTFKACSSCMNEVARIAVLSNWAIAITKAPKHECYKCNNTTLWHKRPKK